MTGAGTRADEGKTQELAAAHGDHRIAFANYQRELTDFVALNRKPLPGGLKGFLPPTRSRIWLRNQTMRAIMATPLRNTMTGDLQKTTNAITLRNYAQAPTFCA